MKQLVFATANPNKIREIKHLMGNSYNFMSLTDIGCHEDIPETQPTIEGNAIQKAQYVLENYGKDCFSEDTGLLIDALDGRPGVYSARYAGDHKNSEDNMDKVLEELGDNTNRSARFKTVIALVLDGQTHTF
ncbi:MAG: non-canonical purine NTP pyrophosphatase, partial [Aureispira sp.]|nr:non-canonical purine NTP pyrophosphatase [Aureispira sp.]